MYENFLIHLSINGHFGGSMCWLLSAKCHEHKGVYIFLDPWFCFMRKILPSVIPASHGSCRVNFLRTCVLFSIVAVPTNFPNKMHEDSPHLHQYLIFVVFWMIASFSGVRCVLLMCISQMIGGINDSFMCLLATCTYSLGKCSVPIFNWIFGGSVVWVLCLFWVWTPFQIYFCKYFLTFSRLPFHFVSGFLCDWKAFQLDRVPLVFSPCFGGQIQKILLRLMSKDVLPMFSSRSFLVSGLTLKYLIHRGVSFVDGTRKDSSVILVHVAVQFSQHHSPKRLSLPHYVVS